MILTVFRSRINDITRPEYDRHVQVTSALAEQMPGFLGHKMFVAEDGERVTLVEFDSMENQRAWSLSAEHKAAAIAGRKGFYSEYRIQVCDVTRESHFPPKKAAPAPATAPARRCPFAASAQQREAAPA